MHICLFSDRYLPDDRGGAGRVAATLAERYAAGDHRVSVITTVRTAEEAGVRMLNGVEVHAIKAPRHPLLRPFYCLYNPLVVPKIKECLKRLSPDIIHAHNVHEFLSYRSLAVADSHGIPIVLTYHDAMSVRFGGKLHHFVQKGSPDEVGQPEQDAYRIGTLEKLQEFAVSWERFREQPIPYVPFYSSIVRRYLRRYVDIGAAVSHELRRALVANDIKCDRVVHNGIDPTRYDIEHNSTATTERIRKKYRISDGRFIFFPGRVGYYKGANNLARAFKRIAPEISELTLVVTGTEDKYVHQMRSIATPHDDRIVTTGWISEEDMPAVYRAATVVASPSIYLDPFPTVNLEAMAAGTPVVTTCFGGAKELVRDRETGIIVNPVETSQLVDAFLKLLTHHNRTRKFGKWGRTHVEQAFNLDDQVDRYLKLFNELVVRRQKR